MSNETRQTIELFAKSLPPALKNAVESVPVAEIIFDIGRKNGLAIDKIGRLADEVIDFILGTSGPEDFVNRLPAALGIDRSKAAAVAGEVNKRIFAAIRDNLKKATTRGEASPAAKKPEPLILTPLGAKTGSSAGQSQEEAPKGAAEMRPKVAEVKPKPPEIFTAPQKPEAILLPPKLPGAHTAEKEASGAEASPKDAGVPSHQVFGPKPTIGELRNALLAKAEAVRGGTPPTEKQEPPRLPGGPINKEELVKEIEKIKLEQGATVRERMTDNSKQGLANKWTGGRRIESGEPETKPEKAPEAGLPKAGVAPERAMPPSVSPSSPPTPPPIRQSDRVAPPALPLRLPPLKLPEQKIPKPSAPESYTVDPYKESIE
ncbi:MAG: hypothetical protein HYT42_00915 [Candidatus Sungbacteria bacterium]|nr:hypothetical protein [Candidatus Sungbacteria bacterium]